MDERQRFHDRLSAALWIEQMERDQEFQRRSRQPHRAPEDGPEPEEVEDREPPEDQS